MKEGWMDGWGAAERRDAGMGRGGEDKRNKAVCLERRSVSRVGVGVLLSQGHVA